MTGRLRGKGGTRCRHKSQARSLLCCCLWIKENVHSLELWQPLCDHEGEPRAARPPWRADSRRAALSRLDDEISLSPATSSQLCEHAHPLYFSKASPSAFVLCYRLHVHAHLFYHIWITPFKPFNKLVLKHNVCVHMRSQKVCVNDHRLNLYQGASGALQPLILTSWSGVRGTSLTPDTWINSAYFWTLYT